MAAVTRKSAGQRLRENFWRRNKASTRVIGGALFIVSVVAMSLTAVRAAAFAYRVSRPRLIAPLPSIAYVDVVARKGMALRIVDRAACERVRVVLNSKAGTWPSRTSFWDALLPVEGVRAPELELSIEAEGKHRVFDVSADELQSEGAATSMEEFDRRELRGVLDQALDGGQ